MLTVTTRHAISPEAARTFDTAALRENFLLQSLFAPGEIRLTYAHYDRLIVGGAEPVGVDLLLDHVHECGTASILDRREMVVVCIAGSGTATAGESFAMEKGDMLYLPMGSGPVTFSGKARFYLLSAPAHSAFPARLVRIAESARIDLGSRQTANERTIYQFVHPDVMQSCQLVVGMTKLETGSVWNTMPAHVHDRRSEAYLYIDLPADQRVIHLMGEPEETRHLVVANEEAILSPPWSIHCGSGTSAYTFVWAMAGDNIDYKDIDPVSMETLK